MFEDFFQVDRDFHKGIFLMRSGYYIVYACSVLIANLQPNVSDDILISCIHFSNYKNKYCG